ncbi:RE1-silencing transcription factor [Mastomys coucha]|uniref:RE1-silencing transcription factor n=1 Tax=Mastomys coucha TaxID=35658 RepID=UPI0012613FB3|nr:RE1-silencing transcription factor [Mastomys coucha]XP_031198685.1 RE1-silencing transcription factor [Mastomys coucha]XP_031198686.1 RE1-silencing transcription factor [Mastomys coucha]XP_031198687.1 RE1-silencing transcription factor [Mastomys coucha]
MATQVMGQSSGGGSLFNNSGNMGMALPNDMYDLHELSKAELAAPQLIMLANVALTGEVNGSCDYLVGEERQMAELMPVGDNNFSDSEGEGLEESAELKGDPSGLENMELSAVEPQPVFEASAAPEIYSANKDPAPETPVAEDKCKNLKAKPFRCKPCQYEAESEEQFVHHIRVHSAKKFFVEESAEKQAKARESGSSPAEEGEFSKGPIRCDRCGYNTNRYDHYTAHLKHHLRAGENERVYKCIICTYTTVSEYHWRKHLRNHFPRKVYTCGKCNYFSDRKNNYVQHVRTHTGERPYKCELCPYSSSQKTHLTRHMRTHSGEKPFKCDQCNYVASNQHEVTRHARQVHNGPKPLNCPYCDYKTADRSNFKKHVELHVNPRQFNCPVCDYAASKKCNLQYHFKSKHPTYPSKTMDVSKVKLKKTKKREADLLSNAVPNEKTETEQTKTKGDASGKKNEKPLKVLGKDVSKEKKPCSNALVVQVTTRTRKSAAETKAAEGKHTDGQTGNSPEKSSCKAKKNKRKMDAETHSSDEPVNEGPVTKKKKKTENKSKNSTEVPKGGSRVEERKRDKKQNAFVKKGAKKTTLKTKTSKKGGKLAQKGVGPTDPPSEELAQVGVSPVPALPQAEVALSGSTQTELPSPMDIAHTEPVQMEVSQTGPPQAEQPLPMEPAQMEPAPPVEPPQVEPPTYMEPPPPTEPADMEPSPPVEPSQIDPSPPNMEPPQVEPPPMEDCQKELPSPVEHAQTVPTQEEPPPVSEPPQAKPIKRSSPRKERAKEKRSMRSETVLQEQVLMEVGLVPVRDSKLLKGSKSAQELPAPPAPPPKGNSREETPKDQEMLSDGEGSKASPLKEVGTDEAGESQEELAAPVESTGVSSSEENSIVPDGETLHSKWHTGSTGDCEMEVDTEQKTDSVPVKDSAAEPVPPLTPTVEREVAVPPLTPTVEREAPSPAVMASPPITLAENESQEIDEDEGIHSHDGSDLSDNMSEGSDDSGLHGARQAPQEATSKNGKAGLAVKVTEGEFVCIFCDRSFRKEKDYSKHLNRHLVNVYFLEEAAEEQEEQEEQEEHRADL